MDDFPPKPDKRSSETGSDSSSSDRGEEAARDPEAAAEAASAEAANAAGGSPRAAAMRTAGRATQNWAAQSRSMLAGLTAGGSAPAAPSSPPPGSSAAPKPAAAPEAAASAAASNITPAARPVPSRDAIAQGSIAYKQEYAKAGLTVREDAGGNPYLYNARESRPATEPERAALVAAVSAQPAALMREPGLYAAMPRQEYAAMRAQTAARGPAAEGPLKDVGVTADGRDMVWARPCDKVSGKCNDSAERSYQTGQAVRGAELSRMWEKARTALAAGAGRSSTPLSLDKSLVSRIFGPRNSGSQERGPAPDAVAPGQAAGDAAPDAKPAGAAAGASLAPRTASMLALSAAAPGARSQWWTLSALLGVLLVLAGVRRRP